MSATAKERRPSEPATPDPEDAPEGPVEPGRFPSVRREVWIGSGIVLLVGAGLLSVGPIVRGTVASRAEALGLRVDVKSAHVGLGVVHLDGLTVSSPELPGISASLAHVEVAPSFTLSPRRVAVHGGTVRIEGTLETLESEVKAWRAAHSRETTKREATHAAVLPVTVDGIDVSWTRPKSEAPSIRNPGTHGAGPANVWGARYERDANGKESVGADRLDAKLGSLRVEAVNERLTLEREGDHRVVTSATAASFLAALDLDTDGAATSDPRAASQPSAGSPPATLSGEVERGPRLRAAIARGAEALASTLRPSSTLSFHGARFELHHAGQVLNVGPAIVALGREANGVVVTVTSGDKEAGTPLSLHLTAPLGNGPVAVAVAGGPLSLAALGVKEHDMGLEDVERAEVEVNGDATLSDDGNALRVSGKSRVSNLSIVDRRLEADPVRGLELALSGKVETDLDGHRVRFDDLEIGVGKVKLRTSGELERAEGHAKGTLRAEIPLAACSDMLASIPRGLIPLLSGVEMKGTYAFSGELAFDTRRPGDTKVDWDTANECHFTKVPDTVSPGRFSHPWVRTVLGADGRPTTTETGPGTPNWVPLYDITPYMATAVVVSEDAGFWVHHGFSQKAIQDSIRANLRAGKFLRGASTVSMQLAKNLYLSREKTLSRKLQEAVLTFLLEESLTKEQILELYFNVIEYAPGLYGIGPAAEHYFKSRPQDLSLGQALYLVSILPNPKIHHFKNDGELSPMWSEYLRHLMTIAHKIHRIDDRDLEAGLAETVRFGMPSGHDGSAQRPEDDSPEGSAPDEILDLGR